MPFCEVDDIKLYYEDYGAEDQVPLIFLHGVMANGQVWQPQVDHFKDRRRTVIFDFRGHGQSDKPRGKYSIKQFSEDLYSFLKKVEIEKAIISGHSMGGMTALRFTLDHQEMVEKLILIDTVAKSLFSFRIKLGFLVLQLAMSIAYESFMKYYISSVFRKDYPKSEIEKVLERVKKLKNPKYVVKSSFSAIKKFDVASELTNIQVPTLIIHGRESVNPLSQAEYMNKNISNAKLVIIEGAGHSLTREAPEKICEAIEKFI